MKLNMNLDITNTGSASDWVKQSRIKEKENKEYDRKQAEIKQRQLEEEENELLEQSKSLYSAADLKGLKVMHSSDYFEEGQDVILTLADTSILNIDDDGKVIGLNDDHDLLENVQFADKDRRLDREQKKRKLNQPVYSALDDYEFQDGIIPGTKAPILQQYDKEKKILPKFELGNDGKVSFGNITNNSESSNQIINRKIIESLETSIKEAKDFYSTKEYTQFSKSKNNNKKKKTLRKKDYNSDDEETLVINNNDSNMMIDDLNEDKKPDVVVEKKIVLPIQFKSIDLDEDDPELAQSLAKSRRLALTKRITIENISNIDDRGAEIAQRLSEKSKVIHTSDLLTKDEETDDIDVDGRRSDGTLVFNSTTEFATKLQARINEKARMKSEELMKGLVERDTSLITSVSRNHNHHHQQGMLTSSDAIAIEHKGEDYMDEEDDDIKSGSINSLTNNNKITRHKVKFVNDQDMDMSDIEEDNEINDEDGEQDDEDDDIDDNQLAFKQPLVAKGMAATLALLKGSGELNKSDELAGRSNDNRAFDPSSDDLGVKLEYRDEFGRKLTQKEAFRQISYRFHGYGPSKKKLEKRLKVMIII